MSVDPRRTQPFCNARCYRECRCSRWPAYINRFGFPVSGNYASVVLGTGPIAYWPLWETSGTTVEELVNGPAQDGMASGLAWANDNLGPFNTPAPYFDGTNSFINLFSATLQAAISGTEGTFCCWARMGTGEWATANNRTVFYTADTSDWLEQIELIKPAANTLRYRYIANGTIETVTNAAMGAYTDWFHIGLTWSASADQVIAYLNGVQTGAIQTVLGAWAGTINFMLLGATSTPPVVNGWLGWLAHPAIWDRALIPAEILAIGTT